MKHFACLSIVFLLGTSQSYAADVGGLTVNGEASFDYNLLSSKDKATPFIGGATNETYRLNQAQVTIKKETEQISFLSRLVYSPTSYLTSTTTSTKSNLGTLDQLEVYYKATPTIYIGFGRFYTTMGFESLLKSENYTYNNTIAFQGIAPGYGEGLRIKYIPSDKLTATLSTYNQATYNAFGDDYTPTKTTEISIAGLWNKFNWFAGYYFGKDGATPVERSEKTASSIWATYKIDQLTLAATYDSRTTRLDGSSTKWSDSTSILVSYIVAMNTITSRYEMVRGAGELFDSASGTNYGSADKVNSFILADKIALNDNFKLHVEYRMDHADAESFFNKDGNPTKDASLLTLGAVASF
ncbi:outer membrane beta-barrel protein [Bdellovibrio svalbardensis]|uniref:Porin n=1 Tax=Bdellovibrio svalbardensis TaxID=2972972 RepID=A0ABT6DPN0_9BACT|nr:outer membrane beta-barrel protein [Bdellovibrio svalbardensis]MDG0817098.1 porin [Bdellovibrio svalbardensis]